MEALVPTNYVLIDFENVQPKKDDMIDAIVKNLVSRGTARPGKLKTLQNTINNFVTENPDDAKLAALVKELQKRGLIVVNQGNIKHMLK